MRRRRLAVSVFAATLLLSVGPVGLASVPPRPLRSALTLVYTLSFRVATDWLVVVALLAVADRYVTAGRTVDRSTVARLTALVFLGGLAIEAAPLVRLVVESRSVGIDPLVRGVVTALQGALFPTGLFVATVLGAAALRDRLVGASGRRGRGGLPIAPGPGRLPAVKPAAAWRAARVLLVVAGVAFAMDAGTKLALGDPHLWLTVTDALVAALATVVDYLVLTLAFLVLAVDGVGVRSLVGGVVGVWAGVFVLSMAVAVLGALAAVALVGVTVTPMAAVEATTLGKWPTPDSWALLLRLATFVAGGVGLLAVQRSTHAWRDTETETDATASDPGTE